MHGMTVARAPSCMLKVNFDDKGGGKQARQGSTIRSG